MAVAPHSGLRTPLLRFRRAEKLTYLARVRHMHGTKGRRQDTDYANETAGQVQGAADDVGIAREPGLPKSMRQKDDIIAAWQAVVSDERPTNLSSNPKDIEKIGADALPSKYLRFAVFDQAAAPAIAIVRDVFDDTATLEQVAAGREREAAHARHRQMFFREANQAVRIAIREGLHQNRMHHTEDGRARADAQGYCPDRNDPESRALAKQTECET